MASVNKQSLREEFEALKNRFAQLCSDGKITAESRALVEALLMLLKVLMAVFMEKNTPKNSSNSSKPASQTPKDETALSRTGAHSKGKAYAQTRSANTRTVQSVHVSKVSCCEECGADLRKLPCQGQERRTQIDLVFEKVVTHVDAEIKACGAHLLRELTFIVEADGYAWAKNMKHLLQQTCARVAKRKRKRLSPREYAQLQKHYRNLITRGAEELPPVPARQNGKRGRIAKSDAHNLWERLKEHEGAVLLFARDPHVAFTNNRAERDLRMSKVKQKVSGCFRKAQYAQAYCRISSYLQTMANRGHNPLVAIQLALSGQLYAQTGE